MAWDGIGENEFGASAAYGGHKKQRTEEDGLTPLAASKEAREMIEKITLPMIPRRLPPMPIFYGDVELSFWAVTCFPDDLDLARKCVARMLAKRDAPQIALQYVEAIIHDVKDGQLSDKEITKRRYWSSAVGQIAKVLYALINDADPRVQEVASWSEAIEQAERIVGRTLRERATSSGFHPQLKRFRRSLHMAAAIEMMRERIRAPKTVDGLMLNAMVIYEHLQAWNVIRHPSNRVNYPAADAYWRWPGMAYDDSHGVPALGIGFDQLAPRGRVGRPRKSRG
jgi:hypothetical protein